MDSIITKPAQIALYRLCVLRERLNLEILGLRFSGKSTYSIVKKELGFKGSPKNVLSQLIAHINRIKETQ